jgi:hypothetical protein
MGKEQSKPSMMEFEEEVQLVRNSKAARSKGWVALVRLDKDDIEFLRPIDAQYSKSGMLVWGIYRFVNGNFYIVASDLSSHKNSRQSYILYFAQNELKMVAEIYFGQLREFYACDDDIKQELRETYSKQQSGRKVINTLIQIAKYYAEREGLIT